ncbi:MAG: phosphoribosylaminoimidazolesuccinocarboxamide synthase [Candidatus Aenigmarchaeota archaeon]|nr:phosphoribosylaminoimidazolesuccinocarboxamide synthase [Candidatus Aenigmarchaeota archaeon]
MEPKLIHRGKVRDVYDVGQGMLHLVSTDRLSAFDIVLADTIPHKGEVLNDVSAYHLQMAGRAGIPTHYVDRTGSGTMLVYRLGMIPVEVIIRGYLYGSAWDRYRRGEFSLPSGTEPRKGAKFSEPMVEFTTKLEASDRPVTADEILHNDWMSANEIAYVVATALRVHQIVEENAAKGGILLADQKLEFGRNLMIDDVPILGDEVGTPDSSRFWNAELYADNYRAGNDQPSFDKQYVRDYLLSARGWDKKRPPAGTHLTEPLLTPEVVARTAEKYLEARTRIITLA